MQRVARLPARVGGPTQATAAFDHVGLQAATGRRRRLDAATSIGGPATRRPMPRRRRPSRTGGGFTVTGSGDIAPAVAGAAGLGTTITQTLVGTFAGLIVVVVVGAMFVTAEYRRGLIRTTLAASPRRGRVLAAKAVVVGAVTFVAGLVAAARRGHRSGQRVLRGNGVYVHPGSTLDRAAGGSSAPRRCSPSPRSSPSALGALLRRGATAVTTAIVVIVLPYLLAMTVLPAGRGAVAAAGHPGRRRSPSSRAAPQYAQVANLYTPADGYFPLPPWAGFAVLAGWAALALALAAVPLAPEGRMRPALHAEWTKLRTVARHRSGCCSAVVVATVGGERRGGRRRRPARPGTAAATRPSSASPGSSSARRSSPSWPCWRSAASTAPA